MGWWKADPVPSPAQSTAPLTAPPTASIDSPSIPSTEPPSACPVDPKTRSKWLQQAKSQHQAHGQAPALPEPHCAIQSDGANAFATSPSTQCSSDTITQHSPAPSSASSTSPKVFRPLYHDRVISSIPRA